MIKNTYSGLLNLWPIYFALTAFLPVYIESNYLLGIITIFLPVFYLFMHFLTKRPIEIKFKIQNTIIGSLIFALVFISSLISNDVGNSLGRISIIILFLFGTYLAALYGHVLLLPRILKRTTVLVLILLILSIFTSDEGLTIRLSQIKSPNSMAALLFGLLPGAFLFRGAIRFLLCSAILYLILVVGSRNGIISFFLFVGIYVFLSSNFKFSLLLFVSFILILFSPILFDLASSLLLIDNQWRGLDTGFTGRVFAWQYGLQLLSERPILGWGFGNSHLEFEEFTMFVAEANYDYNLTGVHNGILATLIELGIPATILISIVFFVLLRQFIKSIESRQLRNLITAFLAGYLFIGLFEEVFINIGNLTSLIFLMLVGMSLKSRRRNL
tara:strand:- start:13032 stop:14186 length:1155 start_codon:yes stop_codon:yes gene_type:complete